MTEDNIIIAKLDNPRTNSVTQETIRILDDVVSKANSQDEIRGIILTGEGKMFSSGFDLPMFLGFKDTEAIVDFFRVEEEFMINLFTCKKPVVAALNGHTVAAGLILAMASDYRIVKNHPKIKIGMSEINIGLPLSVTQTEIMRFGFDSDKKFRDIMYFGQMFNVDGAKAIELVDEIVEEGVLIERAKEIIAQWIDKPGRAFIKLKYGLRKPMADRMRQRLANEDWPKALNCFFEKDVRDTLEMVQKMM